MLFPLCSIYIYAAARLTNAYLKRKKQTINIDCRVITTKFFIAIRCGNGKGKNHGGK